MILLWYGCFFFSNSDLLKYVPFLVRSKSQKYAYHVHNVCPYGNNSRSAEWITRDDTLSTLTAWG
jgi:hypothetical protein